MPITLTEREFAALTRDRTGQKPPLRVKAGSAWHKRARKFKEGPRAPTQVERLAALGFTRRVSDAGVWFEDAAGRRTPIGSTLEDACDKAKELSR